MNNSYNDQKIKTLLNNIKSNKQLLSVLLDHPSYIHLIEDRITSKMQLKLILSNLNNLNYFSKITYKNQLFIYANNFRKINLIKNIHPKILSRIYKKAYINQDFISTINLCSNFQLPENLNLFLIKKDPKLIMYIKDPTKNEQNEFINKINPDSNTELLINVCLEKITNPICLIKLYNKTNSSILKDKIKQSTNWKNDANLILEVIND